jgi:anti-sigma regulatory factor (Ser/Thr protein kinase)
VRHDRTTRTTRETRMPATPDTPAPLRARPRGGRRRTLARASREALIPLGPGDTAAVPALRAIARRVLDAWRIPPHAARDAELALSELATNALLHTRGPVRVRLTHRGGTLSLQVADTSTHHPEPALPASDAPHGRGLVLVTAVATRVRTEPYPGNPAAGKLITAEFDLG